MIYWTHISGSYLLKGSILEKCGKFGKNGRFSGRIWPDWGNTTRADMAGLGSIGLTFIMSPRLTWGNSCYYHSSWSAAIICGHNHVCDEHINSPAPTRGNPRPRDVIMTSPYQQLTIPV